MSSMPRIFALALSVGLGVASIACCGKGSTDPALVSTGDAWKDAAALASQSIGGEPVEKRSDKLPYLFMNDINRGILVHNGVIVRARGPAAAGAYLRDLGVIRGEGPEIEDILFVLFAMRAYPKVDDLPEESFIHYPGDARLAELTARIEHDGKEAHILLHYFRAEPEGRGGVENRGAPAWDPPRSIALAVLVIPLTGDAAWLPTKYIEWQDPAGRGPPPSP
jgi:hypothetical protein